MSTIYTYMYNSYHNREIYNLLLSKEMDYG